MLDAQNMFEPVSVAVTATGVSTNTLELGPNRPTTIMIFVSAVAGTSPTLDIDVEVGETAATADNPVATLIEPITDANGPNADGTGVYKIVFQTEMSHVRLGYTVTGSAGQSFTIIAGIESGQLRQFLDQGDPAAVTP